jgi:hypothetical protein
MLKGKRFHAMDISGLHGFVATGASRSGEARV